VFAAAPADLPGVLESLPGVTVPKLVMIGLLDELAPYQQRLSTALLAAGPPQWQIVYPRGGHVAYLDRCLPVFAGCGADDLPQEQAHARIKRWATAFLVRHVAGDEGQASAWDPVLAQNDPEVQVTVVSGL
jgi:hypothetical protein